MASESKKEGKESSDEERQRIAEKMRNRHSDRRRASSYLPSSDTITNLPDLDAIASVATPPKKIAKPKRRTLQMRSSSFGNESKITKIAFDTATAPSSSSSSSAISSSSITSVSPAKHKKPQTYRSGIMDKPSDV